MDTVRVCETCGSENVRNANESVGFCEDCDGVCTIVDAICTCGDVIDPNAGDYGCIDGIWFCEICI
jgi:hypothetical protein